MADRGRACYVVQRADFEDWLLQRDSRSVGVVWLDKLATDHARDKLIGRRLCNWHRPLPLAVFEHGHAVGDLKHLVQSVRDVNDAAAILAPLPDDFEQRASFGFGSAAVGSSRINS